MHVQFKSTSQVLYTPVLQYMYVVIGRKKELTLSGAIPLLYYIVPL